MEQWGLSFVDVSIPYGSKKKKGEWGSEENEKVWRR